MFSKNMSSSSFIWYASIDIGKSYDCWFRKYLNLLWMAMAWEEEMLKKSTFFVTSLGYHNDSHLSTNLNSKAPKIKELQERLDENSISTNVIKNKKSIIWRFGQNRRTENKLSFSFEKQQWADWTLCNMKKQSAV